MVKFIHEVSSLFIVQFFKGDPLHIFTDFSLVNM